MLAALLPWLHACGTLPEAGFPPFAEFAVVAEYTAPGPQLRLPASTPGLVVQELGVEPPECRQAGTDGAVLLQLPPSCDRVLVRCRYRSYADADGHVQEPASLFPGARLRPWSPP